MVIRDIQRIAGCTYATAWNLNYKVRIAGLTVGLDLGFRGQTNNSLWNAVALKLGVTLREYNSHYFLDTLSRLQYPSVRDDADKTSED